MSSFQLRTIAGPIGLRAKREPVTMTVEGSGEKVVLKDWLKEQQDYHKCVLQTMLLAGVDQKLFDSADPFQKGFTAAMVSELNSKRKALLEGRGRVAVAGSKKKKLHKVEKRDQRERDILVKFSKHMCPQSMNRRERSFIIENGEILVYKGQSASAKLKSTYKLKDATCNVEFRGAVQYPMWDQGYDARLRVDTQERGFERKTPIYLYAKDKQKVNRWKRAFLLARYLTSENDRRALRVSIGRAVSGSLKKGWETLFYYHKEISSTKKLVRHMGVRLKAVEISRGYTKLMMAYREHVEAERFRTEQQLWAARFMSEKLAKLGSTNAKSAGDVRESVITRIQSRFRRFRDDRIFERTYPLNKSLAVSKTQEAKMGRSFDFMMKSVKCQEALLLSFPVQSDEFKQIASLTQMVKTRKPSYSEVNLPLHTAPVFVSDNLMSLSFGSVEAVAMNPQGHHALSKADWTKFVNLDRVSSVVLFTEPVPGATQQNGEKDAGVWFTINGPRVSWCKKVDEKGNVTGVPDGLKLAESIACDFGKSQASALLPTYKGGASPSGAGKPEAPDWKGPSPVWWQEFTVKIGGVEVNNYPEKEMTGEPAPKVSIKVVAHVLGYTFDYVVPMPEIGLEGGISLGAQADKVLGFPVPADEKGPAPTQDVELGEEPPEEANERGFEVMLDTSEVAVEIFEVREYGPDDIQTELLCVGSEFLPKVMGFDEQMPKDFVDQGSRPEYDLKLMGAFAVADKNAKDKSTSSVNIMISPKGKARPKADWKSGDYLGDRGVPVSPEFMGGGVTTAFFTSHRGSWYDPVLGPGKFRADHVANYVELSLQNLLFPKADNKPADFGKKYMVKASLCGFSCSSPILTRPMQHWADVTASSVNHADPKYITRIIKFQGARLFMPLPPGCWCTNFRNKRTILVQVFKLDDSVEATNAAPLNYTEFIGSAKPNANRPQKDDVRLMTPVYQTSIIFDHVLVDFVKPVSAYLAGVAAQKKENYKIPQVDVMHNVVDGDVGDGVLNMDFALRDRDYVKAMIGGCPAPQVTEGTIVEKKSLCIGDKAILLVEEPITYPPVKATIWKDGRPQEDPEFGRKEFRKRMFPGQFDPKKSDAYANKAEYKGYKDYAAKEKWTGTYTNLWPEDGIELRAPMLSSEYAESDLANLTPKEKFKQAFIPNFCKDIVPHTFVLPLNERQFQVMHYPGVYSKIIDQIDKQSKEKKEPDRRASGVKRNVVKKLTCFTKPIPVTLLATYADGTCDVEILPDFMKTWKNQPYRRYAIPGKLRTDPKKPQQQAQRGSQRQVPTAADAVPPRAIVKRVPLGQLQAVHGAGFNIYDANFWTTDDVVEKKGPPQSAFDPRVEEGSDTHYVGEQAVESKKVSLAAGPLPPDALNSTCQYEWSVRMRASNESEMYKFVALLRRCVRLDNFQQSTKMVEYQNKQAAEQPMLDQQRLMQNARPLFGGQLDVLLVEARRLQPAPWLLNRPEFKFGDEYLDLQGTTSAGKAVRHTPQGNDMVSTFVNFRILNDKTVIPFKGQKVQQSAKCKSDCPHWASMDEYRNSGGCLFRTGTIDPERYPDLLMDLEVMQTGPFSIIPSRIGAIQIPVTQKQFLCNPNEPFKNLWVPLVSVNNKVATPNKTGELHIMCRWLPADKIPQGPSAPLQQPVSVKNAFIKEIWPRVCAQRLREPIYNLEVQYLHYNPNLVRDGLPPEKPKDHIQRHAEELYNAVNYLECLERRMQDAWAKFEQGLNESARVRIGEMRLGWMEQNNEEKLNELQDLISRGIPSAQRAEKWAELTLASRVMEREGVNNSRMGREPIPGQNAWDDEYRELLKKGNVMRNDAMSQLAEDCFNLSQWETAAPPIPELFDRHMKRIKQASNVCTALIVTAYDGSGLVYCESLLVLAFFMVLPQGNKEEKGWDDFDSNYHYMSESQVFWLLYTLICTRTNGTYRDYFGTVIPQATAMATSAETPQDMNNMSMMASRPGQALISGSGAMEDVHLLECNVAYHLGDVWQKMNAVGFQLSTVFYGAFMRLYATYMPTSTVFRLWDMLFYASTDPKATPSGRCYLIDLAFGVIKSRRMDILACQSALEVKHVILGVLGTMYDMSTVIDVVLQANIWLWGGGGFGMGKVSQDMVQRHGMFGVVNRTTQKQNEALKAVCQTEPLGKVGTTYQGVCQMGVSTQELSNEVLTVLKNSLQNYTSDGSRRGAPRFWFMHRPQPLCGNLLCSTTVDQAWQVVKNSFDLVSQRPILPRPIAPPKTSYSPDVSKPVTCLEPANITSSDWTEVMQRDIPAWTKHCGDLWLSFKNRQDLVYGMGAGGVTQNQYRTHDELIDGSGKDESLTYGGIWSKILGFSPSPIYTPFDRDGALKGEAETISLNEMIVSLLVASKGTVGEKAAALFQYFAYTDEDVAKVQKTVYHMTPTSKVAKSVTTSADQVNTMDRNVNPPEHGTEEAMKNSLCFTVYSNYPQRGTVVGYVYIPTLGPFISYDSEAEWHHFNIWGKPAPQRRKEANLSSGLQGTMAWMTGKKDAQESIKYAFNPKVNDKPEEVILSELKKSLLAEASKKGGMQEADFNKKLTFEVVEEQTAARGMMGGMMGGAGGGNAGGLSNQSPLMQGGGGFGMGSVEKVVRIAGDTASLDILRLHCKRIEFFSPSPLNGIVAEEQTKLVAVGDMELQVAWTPKSIRVPSEGQLMINIKGIKFNKFFVSDYYKMNPWVKVTTFRTEGGMGKGRTEKVIERWDPRGILKTGGQESWLTTHGAFGGEMNWEQTMRDNIIGQQGQGFAHHIRDGNTMGFNQQTERWEWNEVWGKQYSIEGFKFMEEFVQLSTRKNVMDLHACRLITSSILQRAMLNLTNRQALLISDSIFNRLGVVPGIIEAYLIDCPRKDCFEKNYQSLAEIKTAFGDRSKVDITNKLAVEHEKQIAYNGGLMNLWVDSYVGTGAFTPAARAENPLDAPKPVNINLLSMGIKDPFPYRAKTIWLRYVTGGDGERKTEVIEVDKDGYLVQLNGLEEEENYECSLEKKMVDPNNPHDPMLTMKIVKEEFVSCVMASPLLSESIRRLGFNLGPPTTTRASKLSLDVTIMDPHQEEEDQEFLEMVNVKQSLLFEVWDSDVMSKDFLGEAWLPPLSTIGPRAKDFVLPLQKANFEEDAENGPSRDDNKHISDDPKDINKQVSGELYVTVSWRYPGYYMQDEETLVKTDADGGAAKASNIEKESMSNRAKIQEKLHTGILTIKIEKAKNLRRADAKKGRACDPQVLVWVRNDSNGMWRKKPFVRTPVKNNTRNPVWSYEQTPGSAPGEYPELLAGDYEARFPPIEDGFFAEAKAMFRTERQKKRIQDQRDTTAVKRFGKEGIKIIFTGEGEDGGANQGMMGGMMSSMSSIGQAPDPQAGATMGGDGLGTKHKVEIFNGDSIREFKAKLTQACANEAFHWESMKGNTSNEAIMYRDITVGYRHLVMVFVGSAKVLRLHNQKMHNSPEYHRAYEQAEADPSCWQPLDPARSFSQYPQFGFGKRPQKLRIVEGSEAYKLTNLRYKQFDLEQKQLKVTDRDTEKECFAWAKYVHEADRQGPIEQKDGPRYFEPTYEWRPCLVSLPEDISKSALPTAAAAKAKAAPKPAVGPGLVERSYKVKMMVDPPKPEKGRIWPEPPPEIVPDKKWMRNQVYFDDFYLVPKTDVLVKPRTPLFDGLWAKEHAEFLVQAKDYRKYGKSDFEIATLLNKMLQEKITADNAALEEQGKPPNKQIPPITVDVIRSFMQQEEAKEAKAKAEMDKNAPKR